jgi:hypothetical protein
MWILYIVIAIVLGTGTGVFISSQTNTNIVDTARVEASVTRADQANRIARALRLIQEDNPAMFPARPQPGQAAVPIPQALVGMTLASGAVAPTEFRFFLEADGTITAVATPTGQGPMGDMIPATMDRIVEREGGFSGNYGRLDIADRSGSTTVGPIVIDGGGAGPDETEDGDVNGDQTGIDQPGTDTGGNDTGGTGTGGTGTGGTGTGGTGGTGTGGTGTGGTGTGGTGTEGTGGSGGTGGTGGGTGGTTEDDEIPSADLEDGEGGSTNPQIGTYTVDANGRIIVLDGNENKLGPRAVAVAEETLQVMLEAGAFNVTPPLSRSLVPLAFEDEEGAGTRAQWEKGYLNTCIKAFDFTADDVEARIDRMMRAISPLYMVNGVLNTAALNEHQENLSNSHAIVLAYCISVNNARSADPVFPVRANRANYSNEQLVLYAQTQMQTWYESVNELNNVPRLPAMGQAQQEAGIADARFIVEELNYLALMLRSYATQYPPEYVPPQTGP